MAEQGRHGDEIGSGIEQIASDGAPVRITCGTGVPWGMIVRGGAHTPGAPMTGPLSMVGNQYLHTLHMLY